jgi:hypothetical protein
MRITSSAYHPLVFLALAVVVSSMAWIIVSGFAPIEAARAVVQDRWRYVDGWPYLAWFVLVGPTAVGALIVRVSSEGCKRQSVLSGTTLWQALSWIVIPLLLAYLFVWIPPIRIIALFMMLISIPIRAIVIPTYTMLVLIRYVLMAIRNWEAATWAHEELAIEPIIGVVLGLTWSMVSYREIVALNAHGLVI